MTESYRILLERTIPLLSYCANLINHIFIQHMASVVREYVPTVVVFFLVCFLVAQKGLPSLANECIKHGICLFIMMMIIILIILLIIII